MDLKHVRKRQGLFGCSLIHAFITIYYKMVILHVMIREFLCNGYAMVMVGYVVENFGSGSGYQVVGYGVLVYGCAVVLCGWLCAGGYSYTKESKGHVVKGEKGYISGEKNQHRNKRKGHVVKEKKDDILQEKRHHVMKEKQHIVKEKKNNGQRVYGRNIQRKVMIIIVICERIQALFNSFYLAN